MLAPEAVIERLRLLKGVKPPLWLSGGVAVDFLVGRWTRRHGDIDLIAFHDDRPLVTAALAEIGVELAKEGYWTTKWSFQGTHPADIEVVFVKPADSQTGVLVIPVDDPDRGRAGRYPFIDGYLDDEAWRELDGVRFRTCSLEGEWLNRLGSDDDGGVVEGRRRDPKIAQDRELLGALIPPDRRASLVSRRLPR